MNIICPEETPSEIDAALQEMFENNFFFLPAVLFFSRIFLDVTVRSIYSRCRNDTWEFVPQSD